MKVQKSVIVTRHDDEQYEKSEEEVKKEVSSKNQWIGDDVDTVFKL